MYEFKTNFSEMRKTIIKLSNEYFKKHKIRVLVLGISGGIDSALIAALMNNVGIPLAGVRLPLGGNQPAELHRADLVGTAFCNSWYNLNQDLTGAVNSMLTKCNLNRSNLNKSELIRVGNIKARIRMIYLYDFAKAYNGLVLSTDNFTEYLLGFWTLHGDVGDFAPIQNLWKTEVYGLAEFLVGKYQYDEIYNAADALQACIDAMPTDGLGVTNSDFDQIFPDQDATRSPKQRYHEVDQILLKWIKGNSEDSDHSIILRHTASEFKRCCPVSISRKALEEA